MGHLVAFLCSGPASYLTGLTVAVNGGLLRGISERLATGAASVAGADRICICSHAISR